MLPAAILPFFSTLAGGYAALRLRHRIHAIMALAAGVVVATAGHLLPESQHRDPRRGPALVALAGVGAAIVLAVRAAAPV